MYHLPSASVNEVSRLSALNTTREKLIDDKALHGDVDDDLSRLGLNQYTLPGAQDAIPDCAYDMAWQAFTPNSEPLPKADMFLQQVMDSGEFQTKEESPALEDAVNNLPYKGLKIEPCTLPATIIVFPFRHDPDFIGHEAILDNLVGKCSTPVAAVGGVGPYFSPLPYSGISGTPQLVRTSTFTNPSGDSGTNRTPKLVRTSTITNSSGNGYHPMSLYTTSRAVLKIHGNLGDMSKDWNLEEWDNRRRIVMFEKAQNGAVLSVSFKPVAVNERPSYSICISCIWWEEKSACYVTSVDIIYLLEQLLVAPNRFSVEEKNRIRRNLEGFHPCFVSKNKPENEKFFNIIMAFPHPKPRNIEKDIRMFSWAVLEPALKKIIGKYSASPSSIVPPAATSASSDATLPPTRPALVGLGGIGNGAGPISILPPAPSSASSYAILPATRLALVGPGGIGKTQLAIELAYRLVKLAKMSIFWVNAEDQSSINEDFKTIALNVTPRRQGSTIEASLQASSEWLSEELNGRWVLILDGANDHSIFDDERYLPKSRHGTIIVTTRCRDVAYKLTGNQQNIIEVKPLSVFEAVTLLEKKLGRTVKERFPKNDAASSLVQLLGLMPLSICQAALYMQSICPSIEDKLSETNT